VIGDTDDGFLFALMSEERTNLPGPGFRCVSSSAPTFLHRVQNEGISIIGRSLVEPTFGKALSAGGGILQLADLLERFNPRCIASAGVAFSGSVL
jgi:hypothetical protein